MTSTHVHPVVEQVTHRIIARSARTRAAYLERVHRAENNAPARQRLGCANLAHGFAFAEGEMKAEFRYRPKPNVAIISSYNDMLSAHHPYETYPRQLKQAIYAAGGLAQVAGCVPAMCDGVTQGH